MSKLNKNPQYNAGDMLDLVSLAHTQNEWLQVSLNDLYKEIQYAKDELIKRDVNNQFYFYTLEKKVEIVQHLIGTFEHTYNTEIEKYTAERNGGEA